MIGFKNKNAQLLEANNQLLLEANEQIASLENSIKDYQRTIAQFPVIKQQYDDKISLLEKQIKDLESKHVKEKETFQMLIEEKEKSINARVTNELCSIGVSVFPANEIKSSGEDKDAIMATFNEMPSGVDKSAYYQKHQKIIDQALGI